MFGGIGAISYAIYVDPLKERPQPEPPTHVGLPDYTKQKPPSIRDWNVESERPNLRRDFVTSRRVADITAKFYDDLNVRITVACDAEQLVPKDSEGRSYIPSAHVDLSHDLAENTKYTLGNFLPRLVELRTDNDIAYRTVTKTILPQGVTKPRLGDFRSFFTALNSMSEHWETDLDDYFFLDDDGRSVHGNQTDGDFADPDLMTDVRNLDLAEDLHLPLPPATPLTFSELIARDQESPPLTKVLSNGSNASSDDFLRELYRGRRTSTGSKMPWTFRMDGIRGFVEAAVLPFRCKVGSPRVHPTLLLSGVRLPVNFQSFLVHRVPKERERKGIIEGPLLAAYIRKELEDFDQGTEDEKRDKLRLDQLKEIGSLLHVAQERRRQGRQEKTWNKTVPKGGYWFSEMASDAQVPNGTDANTKEMNNFLAAAMKSNGERKKKSQYESWKAMEPQRSYWDPHVDYQSIGKEEGSEWDEVYLVSSMYYHLSIIKLRVHGAYLDFVATGKMAETTPADADWCRPVLQRTKWFDMFRVKEREEAFQCLWGIMCYLTRKTDDGPKTETTTTTAAKTEAKTENMSYAQALKT